MNTIAVSLIIGGYIVIGFMVLLLKTKLFKRY